MELIYISFYNYYYCHILFFYYSNSRRVDSDDINTALSGLFLAFFLLVILMTALMIADT